MSHWFRAVKVLVHFIGLTGESRNIRLVLESLCVQLAEAYCPQTQLSKVLDHPHGGIHSFITSHRLCCLLMLLSSICPLYTT